MSRLHAPYCNSSIIPSPPALATHPPLDCRCRSRPYIILLHAPPLPPLPPTRSNQANRVSEGIFRSPGYGRGWKSMPNQADDPVMYLAGDPRTACSSALAEEHHIGLKERPPPRCRREREGRRGRPGRAPGRNLEQGHDRESESETD